MFGWSWLESTGACLPSMEKDEETSLSGRPRNLPVLRWDARGRSFFAFLRHGEDCWPRLLCSDQTRSRMLFNYSRTSMCGSIQLRVCSRSPDARWYIRSSSHSPDPFAQAISAWSQILGFWLEAAQGDYDAVHIPPKAPGSLSGNELATARREA